MCDMVSVIMSIYNEDVDVIRESVSSILNQSYNNLEFIIVLDNPYNEKIREELIKYSDIDKRVILIFNEVNLGLAASLNKAIKLSRGTYIARMDADDIAFKNRIAIQKEFMDAHQNVVMCSTQAQKFGEGNGEFRFEYINFEEVKTYLLIWNCIVHPTVMIRKNVMDSFKLEYNEAYRYSQDYELWSRLIQYGEIVVIDRVLLLYRVHKNQITKNKKNEQMNYGMSVVKKLYERNGIEFNPGDFNSHMILVGNRIGNKLEIDELIRYSCRMIEVFSMKGYDKTLLNKFYKFRVIVCICRSSMLLYEKILCFVNNFGFLTIKDINYFLFRLIRIKFH